MPTLIKWSLRMSFLLLLFNLHFSLSSSVHLPYCGAVSNVKRIFNVLDKIYFEEQSKEGKVKTCYWTYDPDLEKYVKADWLYSIAQEKGFRGIHWKTTDKADEDWIELFVIHSENVENGTLVYYNQNHDLFSASKKTGCAFNDPSLRVPNGVSNAFFYQTNKIPYVVGVQENSRQFYCNGQNECNIKLQDSKVAINGIFSVGNNQYAYLNHNRIINMRNPGFRRFHDLFNCTNVLTIDQVMLLVVVVQGVLIVVLIAVNIYIVVRGLTHKPKLEKQSERIKSNVESSTPLHSSQMTGPSSSRKSLKQKQKQSRPKAVKAPKSLVKISKQKQKQKQNAKGKLQLPQKPESSTGVITSQDSIAGCTKRN